MCVVICFLYSWSGEHEIESGKDEKDSSCGLVLMHFSFSFSFLAVGVCKRQLIKVGCFVVQFQDSDASHGATVGVQVVKKLEGSKKIKISRMNEKG